MHIYYPKLVLERCAYRFCRETGNERRTEHARRDERAGHWRSPGDLPSPHDGRREFLSVEGFAHAIAALTAEMPISKTPFGMCQAMAVLLSRVE